MNSFYLLALLVPVALSDNITPKANKPIKGGEFTYYNAVGDGACGRTLTGCVAAVSPTLFDPSAKWVASDLPDKRYVLGDKVCQGMCVKVEYKGKTASFPIEDKCPGCQENHVDLSENAFKVLESNLGVGKAKDATITYVSCDKTQVTKC